MYKVVKSTDAGLDELEIDRLEKGCWIDVVAPSEEELQEIAATTKIQIFKNSFPFFSNQQ